MEIRQAGVPFLDVSAAPRRKFKNFFKDLFAVVTELHVTPFHDHLCSEHRLFQVIGHRAFSITPRKAGHEPVDEIASINVAVETYDRSRIEQRPDSNGFCGKLIFSRSFKNKNSYNQILN